MSGPVRIAMWSGPRNLSTAMMRSFGNRADCIVADEPFYAAYLAMTGSQHPMRDTVIEKGDTDPRSVARKISGAPSGGAALWYQKHMAHHMLPGMPRDWMGSMRHALLIRDPDLVLASYNDRREQVSLADIGIHQSLDMLHAAQDATSRPVPIVEAEDIRRAPEPMLRALCSALDIDFDPGMLNWPSGPQPTDGIWGEHWYKGVWSSTKFDPPPVEPKALPRHLQELSNEVRPIFEKLRERKITAGP